MVAKSIILLVITKVLGYRKTLETYMYQNQTVFNIFDQKH